MKVCSKEAIIMIMINNLFYYSMYFVLFIFFILFLLISVKSENEKNNEGFMCRGKRDGVSGCRDCCLSNYPDRYNNCVGICMDF